MAEQMGHTALVMLQRCRSVAKRENSSLFRYIHLAFLRGIPKTAQSTGHQISYLDAAGSRKEQHMKLGEYLKSQRVARGWTLKPTGATRKKTSAPITLSPRTAVVGSLKKPVTGDTSHPG